MSEQRRYKLSEYIERKQVEAGVEIETDDGQVFHIPAPELWSDDVAKKAQEDNEACVRAMLGDERYDAFVAAGGSSAMVLGILNEVHDLSLGE